MSVCPEATSKLVFNLSHKGREISKLMIRKGGKYSQSENIQGTYQNPDLILKLFSTFL